MQPEQSLPVVMIILVFGEGGASEVVESRLGISLLALSAPFGGRTYAIQCSGVVHIDYRACSTNSQAFRFGIIDVRKLF